MCTVGFMQINFEKDATSAKYRLASRLGKRGAHSSVDNPNSSAAEVVSAREKRARRRKQKAKAGGYSVLERRAPIDPADDGFFLAILLMVVVFTLAVGYTMLRHEKVAQLTGLENLRPK